MEPSHRQLTVQPAARTGLRPEPEVDVEVERFVAGGLGLGHLGDGRVVLVEGGLPGDRVTGTVTEDGARMARATVREVLVPSALRVEPPCPELRRGCGGCDLQHVRPSSQRDLKAEVVADSLRRIARLGGIEIDVGVALPDQGYRTTLRAGVSGGRAGFHGRRSHAVIEVESCMVAHPLLQELLVEGRFADATEVLLRVGARTGERMALVTPTAEGTVLPGDVRVVGADELASGRRVWIHEEIRGQRLRVSARSFFQARPDGAEALVDAVSRALGPLGGARLVDLYGGVGLFSSCLDPAQVTLVERSPDAVADARANLDVAHPTRRRRDHGGGPISDRTSKPGRVRIVRSAVERWQASPADAVVADPSRRGLRAEGVRAVVAAGAERVALVSCDPASLARDVRLLVEAGYEPTGVELVDLFPHTHHVEAVTALRKVDGPAGRKGQP